jgi:hypothetical protein
MKKTLIGAALVSGAVLFAPVANADDASQYAGTGQPRTSISGTSRW